MAADSFIPEKESAVRPAIALGFVVFGLLLMVAVLAYLVPPAAAAQWKNPAVPGVITRKFEPKKGSDYYEVSWKTPDGMAQTGDISPLLGSFKVGQTVTVRYALRDGRRPTLFLDDWLELWGPPVGVLLVAVLVLGTDAWRLVRRLRARPGSEPTPDSGLSP